MRDLLKKQDGYRVSSAGIMKKWKKAFSYKNYFLLYIQCNRVLSISIYQIGNCRCRARGKPKMQDTQHPRITKMTSTRSDCKCVRLTQSICTGMFVALIWRKGVTRNLFYKTRTSKRNCSFRTVFKCYYFFAFNVFLLFFFFVLSRQHFYHHPNSSNSANKGNRRIQTNEYYYYRSLCGWSFIVGYHHRCCCVGLQET